MRLPGFPITLTAARAAIESLYSTSETPGRLCIANLQESLVCQPDSEWVEDDLDLAQWAFHVDGKSVMLITARGRQYLSISTA